MHNGLVTSINQFLSCSWIKCHTICFFNTIIVQVRYIIIETKEVARNGYNGYLFPHSYSGDGLGATHLGLPLSTHAEKKPAISNTGRFFYFNSTVSHWYKFIMF